MINSYISFDDLENLVLGKLKSLGINEKDYPLNPYKMIANENIILQEVGMDNNDIRGMIVAGPNACGIMINGNRCQRSKNFIAMHELSHYWFHKLEERRVCLDNYIDSQRMYEWQANNAASIALMPTSLLARLFCECAGNMACLCDFFDVGIDAMTYRLKNLKKDDLTWRIHTSGFNINFNEFCDKTYNEKLLYRKRV